MVSTHSDVARTHHFMDQHKNLRGSKSNLDTSLTRCYLPIPPWLHIDLHRTLLVRQLKQTGQHRRSADVCYLARQGQWPLLSLEHTAPRRRPTGCTKAVVEDDHALFMQTLQHASTSLIISNKKKMKIQSQRGERFRYRNGQREREQASICSHLRKINHILLLYMLTSKQANFDQGNTKALH